MTRDLGVFTNENTALVLIDSQPELFEILTSEAQANVVELNVRLAHQPSRKRRSPIDQVRLHMNKQKETR